jgi:alkylated DNA repair dioxygenase AlkB
MVRTPFDVAVRSERYRKPNQRRSVASHDEHDIVARMSLPPDLTCIEEYVSGDQGDMLLSRIDSQPWLSDLRRRVQHYGYRYDYKARSVNREMYLGDLPEWAHPLARRLHSEGIFPDVPDQLIVNEYEPGQGISPHIDCVPCFGPVVASLSLGSTCVMELSRDDMMQALLLRPRSLLVLSGEARYQWRHAIRPRRSDVHEGIRLPRARRVSLTFRKVLTAPVAR